MSMYEIDFRDLSHFSRFLKNAPRQITKSAVNTINNSLFGIRYHMINGGMGRFFNIRQPGLIRSHTWVTKVKGNNLSILNGAVGTTWGKRFSGWIEQEIGLYSTRKKIVTWIARKGNPGRMLPKRYRQYSGNTNIKDPNDFSNRFKNRHQKMVAYLSMLKRQHYTGPVKIIGHRKIPSGIYQLFKNKRPEAMQLFDHLQPKLKPWSRKLFFNWYGMGNSFTITFYKEIKKYLKWK